MTMQRCETCRWWKQPDEGNENRGKFGACLKIPTWGLLQTGSLNSHITDEAKAFVPGEAFTPTCLITRPDFGCVHHESRDA